MYPDFPDLIHIFSDTPANGTNNIPWLDNQGREYEPSRKYAPLQRLSEKDFLEGVLFHSVFSNGKVNGFRIICGYVAVFFNL